MMSDFGGRGGLKKIGFYKVKIGIRGGGGVKNNSKKSDIIYERSLTLFQCNGNFDLLHFCRSIDYEWMNE